MINDVPFPDDFRFQWVIETTESHAFDWGMSAGDFSVHYDSGYPDGIYATNTNLATMHMKGGALYVFVVEKRGDVFRVFADGRKMLVTRISGVETPRTISFVTKMGFRLHQLTVEPLSDTTADPQKPSDATSTP